MDTSSSDTTSESSREEREPADLPGNTSGILANPSDVSNPAKAQTTLGNREVMPIQRADNRGAINQKYLLRTDNFMEEEGAQRGTKQHLSRHELRKHETRKMLTKGKMWRTHSKFFGMLPDFRGFEKVKCERIMATETAFKERRMLILIFRWLSPDILLLKLVQVCRNFYRLSWSAELLNNLVYHTFGFRGYQKVRHKVATRLKQIQDIKDGLKLAKDDKPRWLIENSETEESSDFYSSNDEFAAHMRDDGGSSADEENALKDYLRRNAREERKIEKEAKEAQKQK